MSREASRANHLHKIPFNRISKLKARDFTLEGLVFTIDLGIQLNDVLQLKKITANTCLYRNTLALKEKDISSVI